MMQWLTKAIAALSLSRFSRSCITTALLLLPGTLVSVRI